MISTDYVINDQSISIEILTDEQSGEEIGYMICANGKPYIKQLKSGYIPFPKDTMEESAIEHIKDLVNGAELAKQEAEKEERRKEAILTMDDTLNFILTEVLPNVGNMDDTVNYVLTEMLPVLFDENFVSDDENYGYTDSPNNLYPSE